jgi:hypothetical protein
MNESVAVAEDVDAQGPDEGYGLGNGRLSLPEPNMLRSKKHET